VEEGGFVKRLIEEDFPIFEVSKESAREKSIRHGHISTLHIWWARRPLAACRAAIFASLVPDPATLIEPIPEYVDFLLDTLPASPKEEKNEWPNMRARKRLVKFTADISPWEVCSNHHLLKKARKIIEVGTAVINGLRGKELTKVIKGKRKVEMPRILDPFAGGGSIPLEALRLGCEAHALEYNPVAVLILKATLEYPQKYGQKLVKDVEKWGNWVLDEAQKEIGEFYPEEGGSGQRDLLKKSSKANWIPIGYIWARTMQCQNPACGAEIPLMRQFWLRRKEDSDKKIDWSDSIFLHPIVDRDGKRVDFEIIKGKHIEGFDPSKGTRPTARARTSFVCPLCETTYKQKDVQKTANGTGLGQRMIAVAARGMTGHSKKYRIATEKDLHTFGQAVKALAGMSTECNGDCSAIPDESLPYLRSIFNVHVYGMHLWRDLFNPRQLLSVITLMEKLPKVNEKLAEEYRDKEYARIVSTYLAMGIDTVASYLCSIARYRGDNESFERAMDRQALPMVWDYGEVNPFARARGDLNSILKYVGAAVTHCQQVGHEGRVEMGSATRLGFESRSLDAVITDPPYYDSVPYADLSDFFYVWLKRYIGRLYPGLFSTPLSPKSEEAVQLAERNPIYSFKTKEFYENTMLSAFQETSRVLKDGGVFTVVFAHKTTEAWETLVNAVIRAGIVPTSSWPIHTEMGARLRARESAALASSFFLACRKREGNDTAYFKDIKQELNRRIMERLDHFWEQGIRGADFFISAIGPAVEVFGRYGEVKKLSGDKVTVSELLDEVRNQVTQYALSKILHGVSLEKIDPLSRFYVLWRWTYNGETVPYDDARKLAQAVGIELDDIRGKGKLISGKDKIEVAKPDERNPDEVAKRQPMSLIDALHKSCLLWKADKRKQLEKFLTESGFADDPTFWETSQALSELLPDGDKEKQMIQGLLMKAPTISKEAGKQLTLDERWLS